MSPTAPSQADAAGAGTVPLAVAVAVGGAEIADVTAPKSCQALPLGTTCTGRTSSGYPYAIRGPAWD